MWIYIGDEGVRLGGLRHFRKELIKQLIGDPALAQELRCLELNTLQGFVLRDGLPPVAILTQDGNPLASNPLLVRLQPLLLPLGRPAHGRPAFGRPVFVLPAQMPTDALIPLSHAEFVAKNAELVQLVPPICDRPRP